MIVDNRHRLLYYFAPLSEMSTVLREQRLDVDELRWARRAGRSRDTEPVPPPVCAQLSVSSTQVTIPANAGGSHVITVQGDTTGCPVQSINVVVTSGVQATHGSRGLSFTGVHVAELLALALGLLGIGPAVNRAGHRRNRRSRHAAR